MTRRLLSILRESREPLIAFCGARFIQSYGGSLEQLVPAALACGAAFGTLISDINAPSLAGDCNVGANIGSRDESAGGFLTITNRVARNAPAKPAAAMQIHETVCEGDLMAV